MKKFSPVVVAFVSFCLVSFHSNPAFAAVIDAVAPPEDAVTVPLEEPYDATAAAASVLDAIPEEAASVGPGRRRRKLTTKKTGGGQDLIGGETDTNGCNPSTGYDTWCPSLNECIRAWETTCPTTSPVTTPPVMTPPTPAPVPDSLVTSPYTTKVINKTGNNIFFKIGGEKQPLLCQSGGKILPNSASTDSGTYNFLVDNDLTEPICNDAVLASTGCSETLTGDNVEADTSICDLKDGTESVCQCIYKSGAGHCEPKELCKYCKRGLITKGPNPSTNNEVLCVEQTDCSPVYELGVGQVAQITRTGDVGDQRLVASDAPFGWNPFLGEVHGQTLYELGFGANKITHDISIIPAGCDDIPHSDDSHSNLGWGTQQAYCASIPANQISMPSCPRCKDNKTGPAFNFGGKSSCDSGQGPEWSCLGPVEGTWSTGIGQGWPTFCGNPDNSCDVNSNFAQPTVANEGCTQAFFHPSPTPNPNYTCDPYSAVTISICDPTKNYC